MPAATVAEPLHGRDLRPGLIVPRRWPGDTHKRHQRAWTLRYWNGHLRRIVAGQRQCWTLWPGFASRRSSAAGRAGLARGVPGRWSVAVEVAEAASGHVVQQPSAPATTHPTDRIPTLQRSQGAKTFGDRAATSYGSRISDGCTSYGVIGGALSGAPDPFPSKILPKAPVVGTIRA